MVPALAHADPVKVGIANDISGPFSALGAEARDGFNLAIKQLGSKLGGQPAEFLQTDMGGNPDQARQLVTRYIQRDKVDFFTGPIGSNVALAVGPALFAAKVPYLSNNPGPSQFAGAQCNNYWFGSSYQNDAVHEAAGKVAADRGFKKMFIMAPDYPAGKDALAGFKRGYKTAPGDEVYTKLGQIDYAAEIAQIRAAKPDAVYIFLPGGMGINFVKQFVSAGLSQSVKLIGPGFSADEDVIQAVGEPMLGMYNTAQWAHDLDVPQNKAFVEAFRKEYNGRYPSAGRDAAGVGTAHGHGRRRQAGRRQGLRPRGHRQGAGQGRLPLGARQLHLRQEPLPDPGLLPARGRQGRQRPHHQQAGGQGVRQVPGRLRRRLQTIKGGGTRKASRLHNVAWPRGVARIRLRRSVATPP